MTDAVSRRRAQAAARQSSRRERLAQRGLITVTVVVPINQTEEFQKLAKEACQTTHVEKTSPLEPTTRRAARGQRG